MNNPPELFALIRPDLVALVGPLAERSEKLLCERGDFLPHAAVLTDEGKVTMLGAMCNEKELRAVAIAECVDEIPGAGKARAIKVHVEHQRAYTIAFFLPFSQDSAGQYVFGATVSIQVEPEIKVWTQGF